jgi:glyceraldehyde 3-phosphate dehydrogenase
MVKIAINGFGRIGRRVFVEALRKGVKVVAINDIHGVKDAEYLLKYDSVYGNYPGKVSVQGNNLIVDGKKIVVLNEREPENLPWKKLGVDVVIESTGVFRDREGAGKHLKAGSKNVIVSAPMKDGNSDITVVPGVNHDKLKKSHEIISVASCTTNCTAPVVKILDDAFGIKNAFLTTVHAYTSSQALVDGSHKKPRRGRAAALNLVPTSTGAATAVIEAIPKMKGKLDGMAIRAPVPCGSIIDLTVQLKKKAGVEKINEAFKKSAKGKFKGVLEYSEDELVSSDIIGNTHSSIFDSKLTQIQGDFVKVFAWYDNETGYSSRVVDVVKMLK